MTKPYGAGNYSYMQEVRITSHFMVTEPSAASKLIKDYLKNSLPISSDCKQIN